ncbi:methyltransferase domain-containing protein [Candidatus Laterigemmans baculatus]|nr:methyltransferase domain-containing protein [Candidatus Laterigemmans baculatus]
MDDPELGAEEHVAALRGLARLNWFSGVSRQMYRRLRQIALASPRPLRVLDIATGSGDLPIDWLLRSRLEGIPLEVTGVDVSSQAIATARARAAVAGCSSSGEGWTADWWVANALEDCLPDDFDVVTCSLFLHHLEDEDIVRLLRAMRDATEAGGLVRRLLICDLVRSRWNLAAVSVASRLLSRSPIVHGDAALSVRAALTRGEFAELAEVALGMAVPVSSLFPCRFISEIDLR